MVVVFLVFGLVWSFAVVAFFGDMERAMSAPQQCVAIGTALFTIISAYTAMKAIYLWKAIERLEDLHRQSVKTP